MKAIINGVTVEGTAQEIAEYMRLISGQDSAKKHVPLAPWIPYRPEITCADGRIEPYTSTVPIAGKYDMY
ncbi:hypothetical protein [Paenibacillus sp. B-A-8]|uniref:hypothetical protein n=1 Tax=Paenibacillus sp. B-A-8 TaxID=3400419 RepID=UPI003B0106EF